MAAAAAAAAAAAVRCTNLTAPCRADRTPHSLELAKFGFTPSCVSSPEPEPRVASHGCGKAAQRSAFPLVCLASPLPSLLLLLLLVPPPLLLLQLMMMQPPPLALPPPLLPPSLNQDANWTPWREREHCARYPLERPTPIYSEISSPGIGLGWDRMQGSDPVMFSRRSKVIGAFDFPTAMRSW